MEIVTAFFNGRIKGDLIVDGSFVVQISESLQIYNRWRMISNMRCILVMLSNISKFDLFLKF